MEHGPWAARYHAAGLYAQHWGNLPANWAWAAPSLNMRDRTAAVPPPSMHVDHVPNPKLSVRLNAGVSPPDEDLLTRRRQPGRVKPSLSLSKSLVELWKVRAELVNLGKRPPPTNGPTE